MARQDQTIRYSIEVDGDKQLRSIADGLTAIAKSSEEAAPQANALLEELKQIASQNSLADSLVKDKAALQETTDKLEQAKAGLAALNAEFNKADTSNAKISASFAKAEASVASLTLEHNKLAVSLAKTDNALQAAGVNTENLDSAQRDLQASLAGTVAESNALTQSHAKNAAAAKEEAVSIETLSQKYGAFGRIVENVKSLLATVAGLFALEKAKDAIEGIIETGDKFQKFGVDFANAFGGAEKGEAALENIKSLAERVPLSLDQVAEAAIRAKKVGLDPLDGSLEALIDVNAKYAGSADNLNTLIDKLGQAYAKGSLSVKDLSQLQLQGIPATQILATALGKTADQIDDLAKKGELGRESIKLLIDQLGQSASGDAATQMELLGNIAIKVKDEWEEFLNLIGQAGVYDFVKEELQQIEVALKTGIGDGSLAIKAKAISDALVGIGNAALGATKFLFDHADAIKTVAEAYGLVKAAQFALDLIKMANGLRLGTIAALENAAAAQADAAAQAELAAAMEASAVAAAANATAVGAGSVALDTASKVSILQAIKSFSSLRAAANGVGTAITNLVGGPVVGLIASAGFAAVATYKAVEAEIAWGKQIVALTQQQKALAAEQDGLVQKAQAVAAQTKASADVQIATAAQLSAMSKQQSQDYVDLLQNAVKYYTAVQVQAKAAGNTDQYQQATAHLRELIVALGDAKASVDTASASLQHINETAGAASTKFDELSSKGQSAASAIQGVFEKLEFQTPEGLQTTLDIIRQISIRSAEAKDAVQSELVASLEKLDAIDLRNFQQNITDRLAQAKGNATDLTTVLKATLQAELLQIGLTAEQVGVQFTESGQKIIDTFSNIASNAQASGATIQLAFAKALSQADTEGEVDALKQRLQDAFDAGRISAAQFSAGTEAAGRKLAELQVAAAQAGAALDGMGTDGISAAQRLSSALQDTRDKLVIQANQIAAAIAAALQPGGAGEDAADALRAKFNGVDAEIQALNAHIGQLDDGLQKTTDLAAAAITQAQRVQAAQGNASVQANIAGENAQAAAKKAMEGYTEWGDAADAAALATQHITADTSHANDGMAALSQGIANARSEFLSISDAAAKAYDTILKGAFDVGHSDDGAGFDRAARAMQIALDQTNQEIAAQRSQLQNLTDLYSQSGNVGVTAQGAIAQATSGSIADMQELSDEIANGTYNLGLLNQSDLGPLKAALDGAIARAQALADKAKQASDAFESTAQSIADALDQANGNDTAIENRRFQKQLADLKAQATAANALNSQAYQKAVADANALHALNLKNIAAEQKAKNPPAKATSAADSAGPTNTSGASGSGGLDGAFGVPGSTTYNRHNPVNLNISLPGLTAIGSGQNFPAALAELLARQLKPQLDAIAKRSQ